MTGSDRDGQFACLEATVLAGSETMALVLGGSPVGGLWFVRKTQDGYRLVGNGAVVGQYCCRTSNDGHFACREATVLSC